MGKIAVLGLGESLKLFKPLGYDLTIGVNDIWRHHKTELVVCLDYPKVFHADRLKVINECRPQAFYSQIVAWDYRKDFVKIKLENGYPDHFCNLDVAGFQKSFMSPYVAVQIAWRLHGATHIDIYGVDLVNHPHLDRPLCGRIKRHFELLKAALHAEGCEVFVYGNGILTAQT